MIKHLIVALGIAALMSTSALAASKADTKPASAKVVKKVAQEEGSKPKKAKKVKKSKKAKTPAPEEAPAE